MIMFNLLLVLLVTFLYNIKESGIKKKKRFVFSVSLNSCLVNKPFLQTSSQYLPCCTSGKQTWLDNKVTAG